MEEVREKDDNVIAGDAVPEGDAAVAEAEEPAQPDEEDVVVAEPVAEAEPQAEGEPAPEVRAVLATCVACGSLHERVDGRPDAFCVCTCCTIDDASETLRVRLSG